MRFRLVGGLALALATQACAALLEPIGASDTGTLVTIISATCNGKLNSSVAVYLDNQYQGQAGVGGQVSGPALQGLHQFYATTEGNRRTWGPTEIGIDGGSTLRYTLDC